ncbi:MAG: hypothetical protein AB7L09_17065 [Nitrospira sp.]
MGRSTVDRDHGIAVTDPPTVVTMGEIGEERMGKSTWWLRSMTSVRKIAAPIAQKIDRSIEGKIVVRIDNSIGEKTGEKNGRWTGGKTVGKIIDQILMANFEDSIEPITWPVNMAAMGETMPG